MSLEVFYWVVGFGENLLIYGWWGPEKTFIDTWLGSMGHGNDLIVGKKC